MQNNKMEELSISELMSKYNLVVPEIQREYVWGNNNDVIDKFLIDIKEAFENDKINFKKSLESLQNNIQLVSIDSDIEEAYNKYVANRYMNIGFLYSYRPNYFFGEVIQEDAFLIDGQQRFTTLFLALFYFSLLENKQAKFKELFKINESTEGISFDYRVRNLTHDFIIELVNKCKDVNSIENSTWFLSEYKTDTTINSIIKTLKKFSNKFPNNSKNDENNSSSYFDFISNNIKFWHFKTEATSQGEELYITMNSRGEKLAKNEIVKAALFEKETEKIYWGKEWELWQDFFWRNKSLLHENADTSFDEFLNCLKGFHEFQMKNNKDIRFNLAFIQNYIISFQRILNFNTNFNWLIECKKVLRKILNKEFQSNEKKDTDWFVPGDENKGIDNNRMVFVWSILHFLKDVDLILPLTNKEIRDVRMFWVRYNNFDRSIEKLAIKIEELKNGTDLFDPNDNNSTEELEKNKYYLEILGIKDNDEFHINELLIWQIEDHPLNLDGSEVGKINITHLIDFNEKLDSTHIQNIKDCFEDLFPNKIKIGSPFLKTILLHYGDFYRDTSPSYYKRFDFSEWKKNIRKKEFKIFIKEIIGKDIKLYLEILNNKFLLNNKIEISNSISTLPEGLTLRKKLIYYSLLLSTDTLWKEGEKIAICDEVESLRLFKDETMVIYNSKGNFRGYSGYNDLWKEVKRNFKDPINELKKRASL